jgi:TPR repeat protein
MSTLATNVIRACTLAMLILQVTPVMLLGVGCSGHGGAHAQSDRSGEASVKDSAPAPDGGHHDGRSVSPTAQELSPEAEAAFERLTAGRPGDHGQVNKDVGVLVKGCEAGEGTVCSSLGVVYGEGHGVKADLDRAVAYFRLGCEGGAASGCLNLALLYKSGTGVREDASEAASFFEKACDLGNIGACENAAIAHASGNGVPKDFAKAATFYQRACDGGLSPGCTNLGSLLESGRSIPKDLEKARAYYTKGCELGSKNACEAVKRLRKP